MKLLGQINKVFYKYLDWILKQADVVVYPTKFAQNLFNHVNDQLRTEVVSNGVDTNKFRPIDPSLFLEKYKLDPDRKRLL